MWLSSDVAGNTQSGLGSALLTDVTLSPTVTRCPRRCELAANGASGICCNTEMTRRCCSYSQQHLILTESAMCKWIHCKCQHFRPVPFQRIHIFIKLVMEWMRLNIVMLHTCDGMQECKCSTVIIYFFVELVFFPSFSWKLPSVLYHGWAPCRFLDCKTRSISWPDVIKGN